MRTFLGFSSMSRQLRRVQSCLYERTLGRISRWNQLPIMTEMIISGSETRLRGAYETWAGGSSSVFPCRDMLRTKTRSRVAASVSRYDLDGDFRRHQSCCTHRRAALEGLGGFCAW